MRILSARFPLSLAIACAFLGGVIVGHLETARSPAPAGRASPSPSADRLPEPVDAQRIRELWDVLHEKFSGPLDDGRLAHGALRGIAGSTGDPYTAYADRQESRQFEEDLEGAFSGIGIEIGLRRGLITVIAPLRGSPAERAGIRARDIIVSVDGTDIDHQVSLSEVVSKIRGKSGTTVRLDVAREGDRTPRAFTITRERIRLDSVTATTREEIATITLSAFNEDTARRFRTIARGIRADRARGLILDLRNNPGGLLEQSVTIAGHFLPKGTVVVEEVPREGLPRTEHRTDGPADLLELPTVVLVNGGSASAAEILAAALNEQRDIPLVGETTFGKGSVQEFVELSDGSSVRVTIARWHTPKGKEIGEQGIAPSVAVDDPEPENDPDEILEKGRALLRERIGKPPP